MVHPPGQWSGYIRATKFAWNYLWPAVFHTTLQADAVAPLFAMIEGHLCADCMQHQLRGTQRNEDTSHKYVTKREAMQLQFG